MRIAAIMTLATAVLAASSAWSASPDLKPVADALTAARSIPGANVMFDAGPELTPVKRQLRAWVEAQLPSPSFPSDPTQPILLPTPADYAALGEQLSRELGEAGQTCGEPSKGTDRCAGGKLFDWDGHGYLGSVAISSFDNDRYLLVITEVGVHCGYDQSAYLYGHDEHWRWHLLLANEQDDYGPGYASRKFLSITVSPSELAWNEPAPPPLVAMLSYAPWCSSNWNSLTTRLWRASALTTTPRPLIARSDTLYTGDYQVAAAHLSKEDLLIQFQGESIDEAALIRSHVLHFRIKPGDRIARIAPEALGPNDFVEEWLTTRWTEAARWIDRGRASPALQRAHRWYAAAKDALGDFDGPPTGCRADPTLWQSGFTVGATHKHFLVRWLAPYRFTMVDAADHRYPRCDRTDPRASDIGTLFPLEGWTPSSMPPS